MKNRLRLLLAALLCALVPSCKPQRQMLQIAQVTYSAASGSILPELQGTRRSRLRRTAWTLTATVARLDGGQRRNVRRSRRGAADRALFANSSAWTVDRSGASSPTTRRMRQSESYT